MSNTNEPPRAGTPSPENRESRAWVRALGLKRTTGEAYYRRALKEYEEGNLEEAIVDVSEAIYNDRNFGEYYTARGIFYIANGQFDQAEADLQYALRLNKRQWLAHFGMGILRFEGGDYLAALDRFGQASGHYEGARHAEVWFYRAVTHYLLNDPEKASEAIDKAIDLFDAEDRRLREARAWKREIDSTLPASAQKASSPKKPRGKKDKLDPLPGEPKLTSVQALSEQAKASPLDTSGEQPR